MNRYIWHYTFNTGRGRQLPRSEVADRGVSTVAELLNADAFDVMADPHGGKYRCVLVYRSGHCFQAEVYSPQAELLAKMWFAGLSRCGAPMWRRLSTENGNLPRPAEPWLAVRLEPAIARDTGAAAWLGDFEKCLAWAFLERGKL